MTRTTNDNRAERFWTKVNKRGPAECWNWTAAKGTSPVGDPRGQFFWGEGVRLVSASRAAWMLDTGIFLSDRRIEVCHKCDNGLCCNPDHLFIGTHKDNIRDAKTKGRLVMPSPRFGNDNHKAKATPASVREMRTAHAWGGTISAIARQHNMARSSVRSILRGRTWKTESLEG